LKWAREHGCEWDKYTCHFAALGGHLKSLVWAREHGCDWDSDTTYGAALGGQLDCLIWAREHGCDWKPVECRKVAHANRHQNILDWMTSIGF